MILEPDEHGVVGRIYTSPVRRIFALGVVYALGSLLIWLAFSQPPALIWAVVLVVMGIAILFAAERMRRATKMALELTEDALRDSTGVVLARLDEIAKVERGVFALKPSNGFVLVLKDKVPGLWAPGLYWRIGRRVGVGGVTSARETRFFAEHIALVLAMREG